MKLKYIPRPYGAMAVEHLLKMPRCALWAGMGMGKTVLTLTALDIMYMAGVETGPTLILAPLRVARGTWPSEANKWKHIKHISVSAIIGDEKERKAALRKDRSVYTINYDNIVWLMEHLGDKWPFKTVIADESTRLKSYRSRQGGLRAAALSKIAHTKVERWINLTGTPSPNGLKDLWGQTWFLDQGMRLGKNFSSFEQRWFAYKNLKDAVSNKTTIQAIIMPNAQEEIQDRIKDICLTLDPADWFDLEKPIINNVYVDLPAKALSLYKDMEKRLFAEIEGHQVEAFNAASKTMKCLQLANGAAYVDDKGTWKETHKAKLEALDSILQEASGMPVLVAYHFKSDLARLLKHFPEGRRLQSEQDMSDWNEGRIHIAFIHPASAGHGLNLQDGGNIIAFFGHWWNLEEYQQVIERIGPVRQLQAGYKRNVFIYHIVARHTMDEIVMQRRDSKREVQDLLLEAAKRK